MFVLTKTCEYANMTVIETVRLNPDTLEMSWSEISGQDMQQRMIMQNSSPIHPFSRSYCKDVFNAGPSRIIVMDNIEDLRVAWRMQVTNGMSL